MLSADLLLDFIKYKQTIKYGRITEFNPWIYAGNSSLGWSFGSSQSWHVEKSANEFPNWQLLLRK